LNPISTGGKTALACLGLAVLSLALYARAIGFDFVDFDDSTVLLAHPRLYDESSFRASLRQIFFESFPREEPLLLRDVSWALDARVFGFRNPRGYHLGNVVLNAANTALLFLFLHRATRRFGLAASVAGAFAVLPVHVEPVAWVMGRKDVLSTFWVLAALLVQAHELAEPDPRRQRPLRLIALLCMCLALISKIGAATGFLVLALHRTFHPYLDGSRDAGAPLDWGRILRDVIPRTAPHAAVTLGVVAWYRGVVAEYGVIGWRGPGPLEPEHLANVAAFTPLVIGRYLKSLALPAQLSVFHRWPHVEIPLTPVEQAGSIAIAVGLGAALLYCCLRRRDLAFYGSTFLALLLPYLNLVYVDIWSADRYLYLASFCVLCVAAIALASLHARSGRAMRLGIAGLGLAFALGSAVQTLRQQSVWRDNESLWRHEATLDEPSLLAIQALARSYVERAEREADPALRQRLAEAARSEVERGLARERALGRRPSSYATSEQLQLSRLHQLLGRLAAIDGKPLETQLAHYETSHRIAPSRSSAFLIAKTYLELAERAPRAEQERLVRASLRHFLEYVEQSGRDPVRLEKSSTLLTVLYERRFPFLRGEILAARRTHFQ
jgi:hypothetical protein